MTYLYRHMRLIGAVLLSLVLLLGCFWNRSTKTSFTVMRGTSWEGVNLHGKSSNLQGFIDDLLFEIAGKAGIKIEIKRVAETRMLPLLDDQGVDGVISAAPTTIREERAYEFSDPFFAYGPVLVIRSKDDYQSLSMLKDKVVGFERGYGGDFATKNDFEVIFRPYDQMTYAMEDMLNGKIDAVILDSMYAYQLLSGLYSTALKIVRPPLKTLLFRIAVKKGENEELIDHFNEILRELRKGVDYKKLLDYWGLYDPTLDTTPVGS